MIWNFLWNGFYLALLGLVCLPAVEGEVKPHLQRLRYHPMLTWCANQPGFLPPNIHALLPDRVRRFLEESPEIYQGPETVQQSLNNINSYLASLFEEFPTIPRIWRHRSGMIRLLGPVEERLDLGASLNDQIKFRSTAYSKDSFDMMFFRAKSAVPVVLRCTQYEGDVYISILEVTRVVQAMYSWARQHSCGKGIFAVLEHYEEQNHVGRSICILTHSTRAEEIKAPEWPLSPHSFLNDHICSCDLPEERLRLVAAKAITPYEEIFRDAVARPLSAQNITEFLERLTNSRETLGINGKISFPYASIGGAFSIVPQKLFATE